MKLNNFTQERECLQPNLYCLHENFKCLRKNTNKIGMFTYQFSIFYATNINVLNFRIYLL